MKIEYSRFIPATILVAVLAACGQQSAPQEASDPKPMAEETSPAASADSMQGMSMPKDEAAQGQQHNAMGTVTAVDAAAGTVTIAHEAVASAGWPAMTMTFKLANPKQGADLHANDYVQFTFTVGEKGEATVTTILPAGHAM